MATIRLKKAAKKARDEVRDKLEELKKLRLKKASEPRDAALIKQIETLEAEVTPVLGKAKWQDTLEVPDYRVGGYIGEGKPYELAKEQADGSHLETIRKEAVDVASALLESQFSEVSTLPDDTLILLYVLNGGKAKTLTREDAIEALKKSLEGVHFTG